MTDDIWTGGGAPVAQTCYFKNLYAISVLWVNAKFDMLLVQKACRILLDRQNREGPPAHYSKLWGSPILGSGVRRKKRMRLKLRKEAEIYLSTWNDFNNIAHLLKSKRILLYVILYSWPRRNGITVRLLFDLENRITVQ